LKKSMDVLAVMKGVKQGAVTYNEALIDGN
jgi:hypothetical protein